jgi:hypothetical protein
VYDTSPCSAEVRSVGIFGCVFARSQFRFSVFDTRCTAEVISARLQCSSSVYDASRCTAPLAWALSILCIILSVRGVDCLKLAVCEVYFWLASSVVRSRDHSSKHQCSNYQMTCAASMCDLSVSARRRLRTRLAAVRFAAVQSAGLKDFVVASFPQLGTTLYDRDTLIKLRSRPTHLCLNRLVSYS